MRSVQVSVEAREVKAVYTKEMVDEISAYKSLDPEQELMRIFREQELWERSIRRKKSINNIYKNQKTS